MYNNCFFKGYFSKSFPKGFDEIQKGAICVMKTKKKSARTILYLQGDPEWDAPGKTEVYDVQKGAKPNCMRQLQMG